MTTFAAWLKANNYRESTLKSSLAYSKLLERTFVNNDLLPDSGRPTASRILTYVGMEREHDYANVFVSWLQNNGVNPTNRLPKAKPKRRLLEARSMQDAEWKLLKAAVSNSKLPEDQVLYVVLATGLRIGDVLRTPTKELDKSLATGVIDVERKGGSFIPVPIAGLEGPIRTLVASMKKERALTVASFICDVNTSPLAGECAYKRVSRRLAALCESVGVSGRRNLHRLRRTVAVRALKRTKDIVEVQQMLGHTNVTSTQRYTDEIRVDDVAETRRKVLEDD